MRGTDEQSSGRYTYWSWRAWDASLPTLGVITLRPRLAANDGQLVILCELAADLGYGSISVCYLFAVRARGELWKAYLDPVGPANDDILFNRLDGLRVLECWGRQGDYRRRASSLTFDPRYAGLEVFRLETQSDGSPIHPCSLRFRLRRFV